MERTSDTFIIHYDTNLDLDSIEIENPQKKENIKNCLHHEIETIDGEEIERRKFYRRVIEPVKEEMRQDIKDKLEELVKEEVEVDEIKLENVEAANE